MMCNCFGLKCLSSLGIIFWVMFGGGSRVSFFLVFMVDGLCLVRCWILWFSLM